MNNYYWNTVKASMGKKRKYNNNGGSFAWKAAKAAAKAAAHIYAPNIAGLLSDREGPSGAISSQHDSKLLYKRRRAPRRVRRRAARRYRNFLSNQLKAQNDQTNLFKLYQTGSSAAGSQQVASITSGYVDTNNTDAVGDLYQVFQNVEATNPVLTAKRWYLTGMSTDYTIKNTSSTETMELDVYEFVCRRTHVQNENQSTSVAGWLSNVLDDEEKMPGATSKMNIADLGYVPTDSNECMRYIVIQSKQRFYLGPGNACSFTKRIRYKSPKFPTLRS
jgi:hypothetical protein